DRPPPQPDHGDEHQHDRARGGEPGHQARGERRGAEQVDGEQQRRHPGEAPPVLGDHDRDEPALFAAAQQLADLRPAGERLLDPGELLAHARSSLPPAVRPAVPVTSSSAVPPGAAATAAAGSSSPPRSSRSTSAWRSATRRELSTSRERIAAASDSENSAASAPPISSWAIARKFTVPSSPTCTTCGSRA